MRCFVLCLLVLVLGSGARGAVRAEHGGAVIELGSNVFPVASLSDQFSVLMWFRPEEVANGARSLFEVPGVFWLGTDDEGQIRARVSGLDAQAQSIELSVVARGAMRPGEWTLVGLSTRTTAGLLQVFAVDSEGLRTADIETGQELTLLPTLADGARLGRSSDGVPAFIGTYGVLAVRSQMVSGADVQVAFDSRRAFAPYDTDTRPGGGMNGRNGTFWMLNHAMTTQPTDVDAGGERWERAAIVGEPVGLHNVHVFDRVQVGLEEFERFNQVRAAVEVDGFGYASVHEPPVDGWFVRDQSNVYEPVGGASPLARRLATRPHRLMRVMVSANSRAVQRSDGSDVAPGNYVHGLIDLQREHTAGVYFRPAVRSELGPWFGFDCIEAPLQSRTFLIDSTGGKYRAFSRMWTGSARGPSLGPGAGLFVESEGFYEMRARPEPGSLMTADAPLTVQAHVLAFPGASSVQWRATRGVSQAGASVDASDSQVVALDTQVMSRLFGIGDSILNASTIQLVGNLNGSVSAGDAMYISEGPGAGQLYVIKSVVQVDTQATIQFTLPMSASPSQGSVMRFGPWRFETLEHEFGPVEAGDAFEWRGLRLEAAQDGAGFAVFGYSAWRPDVNGFVFGASGWGGNGYLIQLLFSDDGARRAWMAQSQTDVWLVVPAQQNSLPEQMSDWTHEIRTALPECEVVWAGEGDHPSGTMLSWPNYIVANAEAEGVVAVIAHDASSIGTSLEQLGDGHRSNLPHLSRRGNLLLAREWTDQLHAVAVDPCPEDLAQPWGVLDFFDLLAFLGYFSGGDLLADVNEDGVLDFFDIVQVLGALAEGCG